MYSISSSDKIKRCPCCGNQYPSEIRDNNTVYVQCSHCGFKTKEYYYTDKQKAIDEWNNSVSPWHTGTPTEEGWYLLHTKISIDKPYCVAYMDGRHWLGINDFFIMTDDVIEWQKINEGGEE